MTPEDLLALSERVLLQLEFDYGTQVEDADGRVLMVATDDDRTILVQADGFEDEAERTWPVLVFLTVLLVDVDPRKADSDLLVQANTECDFGSVVLTDARELWLHHVCVGWPGGAEFRVTLDLLATSAGSVLEALGDRIPGDAPLPYSELVT